MQTQALADATETFIQRMAVVILIVALIHVNDSLQELVGETVKTYLYWAEKAAASGLLIALLAATYAFTRVRKAHSDKRFEPEGYIVSIGYKACFYAIVATHIFIVLFDYVPERLLADLSTDFVTNLYRAALLGSLSISFFYLMWRDNKEEDIEADELEQTHE